MAPLPPGYTMCPVCRARGYRGSAPTCPDCAGSTPVVADQVAPHVGSGRVVRGRPSSVDKPAGASHPSVPPRPIPTSAPVDVDDHVAPDQPAGQLASGAPRTFRLVMPVRDLPDRNLNNRDAHWSDRSRERGQITQATLMSSAVRRWAGQLPLGRCEVNLLLRPADRRLRDPDNLAEVVKAMVDGLVAAGVLPADDWRYVRGVRQSIDPDATDCPADHYVLTATEI